MRKYTSRKGETLTVVDEIEVAVGDRFRAAIKRKHPTHTVKRVSRDLDASPATVKGWLRPGSLPQNRHLLRAFAIYGPDFTSEVLEPITAKQRDARVRLLEAERARIEAELAELEGEGNARD